VSLKIPHTPSHFNGDYEVWLTIIIPVSKPDTIENSLRSDGLALELANEFLEKKNLSLESVCRF
jgi:hypothetical protein